MSVLPVELAALATTKAEIGWLTLADMWWGGTADEQTVSSRMACSLLSGSFGRQRVAWEDLRRAVELWHRWDTAADGQGRTSELSIPSRERVCDLVTDALGLVLAAAA